MFNNIFDNKTVLITGHTGFKGSWLSSWLIYMGARVIGVSDNIPTEPSNYQVLRLKGKVKDIRMDICETESLTKVISNEAPDFIFHMAAQALVRESYENPLVTVKSNTFGTVSLLEAVRNSTINKRLSVMLVTSDKVYANKEWSWGYRENDQLGGNDLYSSSKAAAELLIASYLTSFFKVQDNDIRFSIVRAGNVIGGGDWAKDRIVPDVMRAAEKGNSVILRYPDSTRPWQHVLEPISGYLLLAEKSFMETTYNYEAFNFGPDITYNKTVLDLVNQLSLSWPNISVEVKTEEVNQKEAKLLKLVCDKANSLLQWTPVLNFEQTCEFTASWYKKYYKNKSIDMEEFTLNQIQEYSNLAKKRGLKWA